MKGLVLKEYIGLSDMHLAPKTFKTCYCQNIVKQEKDENSKLK